MTIKEFANLCSCNTQTLRYYDRIDLLKPVRVDPWSRYRYYEKAQAIDFIKIKNLQLADFSIEEIKGLLDKSDQEVYDAFTRKIAEQQEKLERIRQIQQSYLQEKMVMEKFIQGLSDFLLSQISDFEGLREFGLTPGDSERIVSLVREHLQKKLTESMPDSREVCLTVGDEKVSGTDNVLEKIHALDARALEGDIILGISGEVEAEPAGSEEYETVWEKHDWQHVYEFMDQIPALEAGKEYLFNFLLIQDQDWKADISIAFPLFMMGAMLLKNESHRGIKGCSVEKSQDGKNHFALMRKK